MAKVTITAAEAKVLGCKPGTIEVPMVAETPTTKQGTPRSNPGIICANPDGSGPANLAYGGRYCDGPDGAVVRIGLVVKPRGAVKAGGGSKVLA